MQAGASTHKRVALVLIGVSGSGKSTVGRLLAASLGATFLEGDSYHSSASIAKMRAGTPLRDADREPWLDKVAGAIGVHVRDGRTVVAACSALKRVYRARLTRTSRLPLVFVHLALDPKVLEPRLRARRQHFMPASLLKSQMDTLEPLGPDENGTTIVETGTARQTVAAIQRWLRVPAHDGGRGRGHPKRKAAPPPSFSRTL